MSARAAYRTVANGGPRVAKARVVGSLLILIALWPLVHRQLVTRLDVNPWKLYGFAMYCTPHGLAVELIDRGASRPRKLERGSLPPRVLRALDHFETRRGTLGRLHPPDALAREVFAALPEIRELSVAVTVVSLQPGATKLTPRTRIYGYEPPSTLP